MGLFDIFKSTDGSQQRLKDLIVHNAKIIQKSEGRSPSDSEYIAICMIIDDLSKRPNGAEGYQKIMAILQRDYKNHLSDVLIYVAWSNGKLHLKPEAEAALIKRHEMQAIGPDMDSERLGFSEQDGEKLILAQQNDCINKIAEKWLHYNQVFKFKPEVPLSEIIEGFGIPMQEFVKAAYPLLYRAGPEFFWLMTFRGIQKTASPSLDAVNRAMEELDTKFRRSAR